MHKVQEMCSRIASFVEQENYSPKPLNAEEEEDNIELRNRCSKYSEEDDTPVTVSNSDKFAGEDFGFDLLQHDFKSKVWARDYLMRLVGSGDSIPREINLWLPENFALPLSYIVVGTFQGLSGGIMTIFLLHIGATEAQQLSIQTLRALPSSFKVLFGFLSDSTPIFGYRRKVYMFLGWLLSSVAMMSLFAHPKPTIPTLSCLYFLFGLGFWFADTVADSVMAEKVRFEPERLKGNMQSFCYGCRFFAIVISSIVATYCMQSSSSSPKTLFGVMAVLPLIVMIPSLILMKEEKMEVVSSASSQCKEVWNTVCSRAVWQPMAFVFMFNLLQVGNAAWAQYLFTTLKFTNVQINAFAIAANVLVYVGVLLYQSFMLKWSWRWLYIGSAALNLILSVMQVLLLLRINVQWGISNFAFAFGDDALGDLMAGILFLPTTIMMAELCPRGSEGVSYALFTSTSNAGDMVSMALSSLMLGIWDVSEDALQRGDMRGMINLTVLTSAIQIAATGLVVLLPHNTKGLAKLNYAEKSKIGGGLFLAIVFLSVLCSVLSMILNIAYPGWTYGSA